MSERDPNRPYFAPPEAEWRARLQERHDKGELRGGDEPLDVDTESVEAEADREPGGVFEPPRVWSTEDKLIAVLQRYHEFEAEQHRTNRRLWSAIVVLALGAASLGVWQAYAVAATGVEEIGAQP